MRIAANIFPTPEYHAVDSFVVIKHVSLGELTHFLISGRNRNRGIVCFDAPTGQLAMGDNVHTCIRILKENDYYAWTLDLPLFVEYPGKSVYVGTLREITPEYAKQLAEV